MADRGSRDRSLALQYPDRCFITEPVNLVMRNTIALILGGGRGTRLFPLTKYRSKPAVPLAGKYRLIDIPISNCINSDINRIYVLTQFLSVSLHQHIRQTYRFDHFNGGFVELLAATQTAEQGPDWFQGTADAVRKNLPYIEQQGIEYVLILSGDQLYRMDFREMLRSHIEAKADVTIAGIPVHRDAARALGIMRIDGQGRVVGFLEKPQTDAEVDLVRMDPAWLHGRGIDLRGRDLLASMGLYVFNRRALLDLLTKTDYQDFGREVFPAAIRSRHVQVHLFDDYWEDIGTIRAFYDANLSLCSKAPPFDLTIPHSPIYTRARFLPPNLLEGSVTVRNSLIADGCTIGDGTTIENSIIGLRCAIGRNVVIRDSVLMGADFSQSLEERQADMTAGRVPLGIGDGSHVIGSIVDKDCRIGRNVRIVNSRDWVNADAGRDCLVRDGIPVVVKNAVLQDGWLLHAEELPSGAA
jgi:glucose-1-phosphate adenylyltransferase